MIVNALEMGLIFSITAIGIFITFKILNLPDLTVDGSYILGAAISAVLTLHNHSILGVIFAGICGFLAGCITGVLYTKLKINEILSGILVMTGLYSINLRIMGGRPNVPISGNKSVFDYLSFIIYGKIIMILIILLIVTCILYWFLKTQIGLAMIATGDNEDMVRASSIDSDAMKILGIGIGNAIVAISGALMCNYLGFADISSGTGMMLIGIASIILGISIVGDKTILRCFIAVVIGSILYRIILAIALSLGLGAGDLKLLSSVLVVLSLGLPRLRKGRVN